MNTPLTNPVPGLRRHEDLSIEKAGAGIRVTKPERPKIRELDADARKLKMYRQKPSLWVENHFDIQLARYRDRAELEAWLDEQPDDAHAWLRSRINDLTLDPSRSYQADALNLLAEPQENVRIALQWANSVAKTATAAMMVHYFLDCYPNGVIVTTAGTWSQLKEQLWGEIGLWGEKAVLPICSNQVPIFKTHIDLGPQWKAFGRAAKEEGTFEGVHAEYVMVIMDEAKAIPQIVHDQCRRILRGSTKTWWIQLSTPGSPTGPYYDITQGDQSHRWMVHHVSAYESERVTLEQIQEDNEDLGDDSPLFISMVCSDYPDETEFTVIPLSWAQACVNREAEAGPKYLGVDVARFGSDETVIYELKGRQAKMVANYNGKDTTWTAGKIQTLYSERGPYKSVLIDDTGVGGGVTDQVKNPGGRKRSGTISVTPINFGSRKVMRKDVYHNVRTEMYFFLRGSMKQSADKPDDPTTGLSIPNDKRLIHQLTSQEYGYTVDGLFMMKSKDEGETAKQLRKRGEKSPDRADALALAHYGPRRARKRPLRALPHDVMPAS